MLMTLILFLLILSGNITAVTTTSREVWAFARDGGFPFSRWMARVSKRYNAPLNAVWVTSGLSVILCLINLGEYCILPALCTSWKLTAATRICGGLQYHHQPEPRGLPGHVHSEHRLRAEQEAARGEAAAGPLEPGPLGYPDQHLRRCLLRLCLCLQLLPRLDPGRRRRRQLRPSNLRSRHLDRRCLLRSPGPEDIRRTRRVRRGQKTRGRGAAVFGRLMPFFRSCFILPSPNK